MATGKSIELLENRIRSLECCCSEVGEHTHVIADITDFDTHTHTASEVTDFDTAAQTAAVEDAIANGVTTIAPSQNAVFDALAGKSDIGHTHVVADITDFPIILSGTYTPVVSSSSNTDAVTPLNTVYHRVGSMVTVTGAFEVDVTTAGIPVTFTIDPPIIPGLAEAQEAVGMGTTQTTITDIVLITGNGNEVEFTILNPTEDTAVHTFYYHYTYWLNV